MRPIVAADLMTPDVLSVPETMGLGELSAFLLDHQISGVVVRDEEGQPVGVVSLTDLAAVTADAADAAAEGNFSTADAASHLVTRPPPSCRRRRSRQKGTNFTTLAVAA